MVVAMLAGCSTAVKVPSSVIKLPDGTTLELPKNAMSKNFKAKKGDIEISWDLLIVTNDVPVVEAAAKGQTDNIKAMGEAIKDNIAASKDLLEAAAAATGKGMTP